MILQLSLTFHGKTNLNLVEVSDSESNFASSLHHKLSVFNRFVQNLTPINQITKKVLDILSYSICLTIIIKMLKSKWCSVHARTKKRKSRNSLKKVRQMRSLPKPCQMENSYSLHDLKFFFFCLIELQVL
jgi:hypothetical protein